METENWIKIPGCSKFSISDLGRCRNTVTGNMLRVFNLKSDKGKEIKRQYIRPYRDDGKQIKIVLDRLILRLFVREPNEHELCIHIDGNFKNKIQSPQFIHKSTSQPNGYARVGLRVKGEKGEMKYVHELVLISFGLPKPSPEHTVDHIDSNSINNDFVNLQWLTRKEHGKKTSESGVLGRKTPYPEHSIRGIDITVDDIRNNYENEKWCYVNEYPKYIVSSSGRVGSLKGKGKIHILQPGLNTWGYITVNLYNNSGEKSFRAHKLVAEQFIPNPDNKPTVDHINENKTDNRVVNLRWATPGEQLKYVDVNRINRGADHPLSKLTGSQVLEIKQRIASGERNVDIAKDYDVNPRTISSIRTGKAHKHI